MKIFIRWEKHIYSATSENYTPFTRWSWLDELARWALVEPASSCKRGIKLS